MAGTYNGGRSGVNLSFYLEKLTQVDEPLLDIHDDTSLAMFANTSWFDFDMGQSLDDADVRSGKESSTGATPPAPTINDEQLEFMKDLEALGLPKLPLDDTLVVTDQPTGGVEDAFTSGATSPMTTIGSPLHSPVAHSPATHSRQISSRAPAKRKASIPSMPHLSPEADSFEEASRLAAEEDKRRRNTAASARFRVKKKQREQALERSAREMSEKVGRLEQKINQLEMENKWLKNLIVEKKAPNGDKIPIPIPVPALLKQDPDEEFAAKLKAAMDADGIFDPNFQSRDRISMRGGDN